ncbi:hypothetical protein OC845_003476 [Tilletia horrida]|nr:hypothetical protein OC845_003476 [Tilletia horrida]
MSEPPTKPEETPQDAGDPATQTTDGGQEQPSQVSESASMPSPSQAEEQFSIGLDVEQDEEQQDPASNDPPAPPPVPKSDPPADPSSLATHASSSSTASSSSSPFPPVPSIKKRPSKHAGPPKPILRPPGSSHTASHNPLITGVAAAASLLPSNAKPALASFLQNINTRLAQGGVGVQVPIPQSLTPNVPGAGNIPGQGLAYSSAAANQSSTARASVPSSSSSAPSATGRPSPYSSSYAHTQASQQQHHYGSTHQAHGSYGSLTSSSSTAVGATLTPAPGAAAATSASSLLNGVLRRFSGAAPSTSGGSGSGSSTPTRGDPYGYRTSAGETGGPASPTDARSPSASAPNAAAQQPSIRPLRRVQFRPTMMTVTYPIINTIAPADEDATRRRVEAEHRARLVELYGEDYGAMRSASSSSLDLSASVSGSGSKGKGKKKVWTVDEIEELYTRCCRIRQEWPLKKMRQSFQEARAAAANAPKGTGAPPLPILDLSTIPLDQDAVDPLADFLSVEFGLSKLILENCMLTDEGVKAFLHALLISGTLPNLSLASNKKIKSQGWKYVALFIRRAQALRYLDLSENVLNKSALAEIVAALERAPRELVSPAEEKRKKKDVKAATEGDGDVNGRTEADAELDELDAEEQEFQPVLDELPLMPAAPLLRSYDSVSMISTASSSSSTSSFMTSTAHYSQLASLRLENCSIKTSSLETLAQGVRASDLRHLSLRRNKISNAGAAALAIMLRDYPDVISSSVTAEANGLSLGEGSDTSGSMPYAVRSGSLSLATSGRTHQAMPNQVVGAGGSVVAVAAGVRKDPRRTSYLLSPTESSPIDGNIGSGAQAGSVTYMSPMLPSVPQIVTSPQGGVTSRRMSATPTPLSPDATNEPNSHNPADADGSGHRQEKELERSQQGDARILAARSQGSAPNAAIHVATYDPALLAEQALAQAKAQRAFLANLPRIGALLTLDLKSNDIGNGVAYLAQALKKNRTLRVLNLSDCNIDVTGLMAMADMLKYNATLETLDLSHNQCCGPTLDGIATLRTAFTLNFGLKRLFLSDTDLSSEGAICLAEFLPEAKSLIHLDLTENYEIDIAGVMALAVSLRMNTSLRCLDLNVPPNNPEFSRLSQEILQSCVRNTEEAQRRATQRGVKQPVAAPIYRSAVARAAKAEDAQREAEAAQRTRAETVRAKREKKVKDTLEAAQECAKVLADLLDGAATSGNSSADGTKSGDTAPGDQIEGIGTLKPGQQELLMDLLAQSTRLRERLAVFAASLKDGKLLAQTLHLNDELDRLATRASSLRAAPPPTSVLSPQASVASLDSPFLAAPGQMESGLSSPSFSIGSDEEDEDGNTNASVEENLRRASETLSASSSREDQLVDDSQLDRGRGAGDELSPRPSSSSATPAKRDLPSLTINLDGLEAEKVEPPPEEFDETTPSPADYRAKGQLSEEGEIFRKAKSLMLVEESGLGPDDELLGEGEPRKEPEQDAPTSQERDGPADPASTHPNSEHAVPAADLGQIRTRQKRSPSTESAVSHSSRSSGGSATGAEGVNFDPEVSGERLRKEILEADIPKVHRRGSSDSSSAGPDGAGAA